MYFYSTLGGGQFGGDGFLTGQYNLIISIIQRRVAEPLPVEPGEAEWNLETLEFLFDFFYVQPAKIKKRKEALNEKLKQAGKPEMK